MTAVVIYRFFCNVSGKSYIGKHECEPSNWPTYGVGRLPDGYGGTGKWIKAARRKYADAAFTWKILEVVPSGADWEVAEQRHVEAERARAGKLCMNIVDGGQGYSSAQAKRNWQNRGWRAKVLQAKAGLEFRDMLSGLTRRNWQNLAYREKMLTALSNRNVGSKTRQKMRKPAKRRWSDPTIRAVYERNLKLANPKAARMGANRNRLSGAIRRRNANLQPLPGDNDLLSAAGERLNALPLITPKQRQLWGKVARALEALRFGPKTAEQLAAATHRQLPKTDNPVITGLSGAPEPPCPTRAGTQLLRSA